MYLLIKNCRWTEDAKLGELNVPTQNSIFSHISKINHFKTYKIITIPYHTIPYHTIPYHTIPYHWPYHTIDHTIPCHTIPYHTIPYHTIPYHTIPYHTIPYHTIPYHTIPYITMQYFIDTPLVGLSGKNNLQFSLKILFSWPLTKKILWRYYVIKPRNRLSLTTVYAWQSTSRDTPDKNLF